jgi:hypothetical protein
MTGINITPDDQRVFDRLKSTGRITHSLKKLMTNQWNSCSACGGAIPKGRPVFAGYDIQANPIFVGVCCADHLSELASPTYWGVTHTLNIAVRDEQVLWRYMDFAKFLAMLKQKGLYFAKADRLEDPFEGAMGLARREEAWDSYYLEYFRRVVATPPPGSAVRDLSPQDIESSAQRLLEQLKAGNLKDRSSLVSCWHANTVESEALWRLYCPPSTAGVAIRTTARALWAATSEEPSAVVGRVHYVDFRTDYADLQERIFCKRLSLAHENEVRAVIQGNLDSSIGGRLVLCELASLIECVVVSPFAPPWFPEIAEDVTDRFGYNFEVRPSELLDQPFY